MKTFQVPKQLWSDTRDGFGAAVAEEQNLKKREETREKSHKKN